jgi:hypothetical protein
MVLEIFVKRRDEVFGQLIPAAFRPASRVAGLTWPPQVGWPLLRLVNSVILNPLASREGQWRTLVVPQATGISALPWDANPVVGGLPAGFSATTERAVLSELLKFCSSITLAPQHLEPSV